MGILTHNDECFSGLLILLFMCKNVWLPIIENFIVYYIGLFLIEWGNNNN